MNKRGKMEPWLIVVLLALSTFIFFPNTVSAASAWVLPAAADWNSGTMIVNISTDLATAVNATIFYNATGAGGAGISFNKTELIILQNTSVIDFYASIDISTIPDWATVNITARITALDAAEEWIDGCIVVGVDNTAPVSAISLDTSKATAGRTVIYSTNETDATSGLVTSTSLCTATDPSGGSHTLLNYASGVSYNLDRTVDEGTWTFKCESIDNADNAHNASTTVDTHLSGYAVQTNTGTGVAGGMSRTTLLLIIAGIVLVIYFIGKKR